MSEDSISNQIYKEFEAGIKGNRLFEDISSDIVNAIKQKDGKIKIKEILRDNRDANTKP